MKLGLIGALAGMCIGVAVYLMVAKKPEPAPALSASPAVAVPSPITQPTPAVLAEVVEVADLDPLLDPPAKPVTGTPFDADSRTMPASAPAAPARIPPAID